MAIFPNWSWTLNLLPKVFTKVNLSKLTILVTRDRPKETEDFIHWASKYSFFLSCIARNHGPSLLSHILIYHGLPMAISSIYRKKS